MNALTLLKQDHGNVEALFERFERSDDPAEKRQIVDNVILQLSVHAAVEEQVFYPAVRAAAAEATPVVLESLEEHHVVKWTLSELERMAPTDERFDAKVQVLMESVRHHVKEEEETLFPQVREAMTVQELEELGEALQQARQAAPTRPHPRTPDTPPLNLILGVPAAIVDRALRTGRQTVGRLLNRAS